MLFHITTREQWERARAAGTYAPPSLATEGFIHLSYARQWPGAANRFYRGRSGLVLLAIDPARLGDAVRDELADGDMFPHLYAALDVGAVVEVRELAVGADGGFTG